VPTGLTAVPISQSQINLNWSASTDNVGFAGVVGVFGYQVWRDGVLRTTVGAPTTTFPDTGLQAAQTYTYKIAACDLSGNCSAQSTPGVLATTPDTEAPTVPTGLTATGASATTIAIAWTASGDNVAVTAYKVFRNSVQVGTVASPTLTFGDTGLTAATSYTYTVSACDFAGNCSAQSAPLQAGTYTTYTPVIPVAGFSLLGNSLGTPIDVVTYFGNAGAPVANVSSKIISLWKWNAAVDRWAFYSPQSLHAVSVTFAASNGYDLLTTINPGEGYWVNVDLAAALPATLPQQTGPLFSYNGTNFPTLLVSQDATHSGWNMISTSDAITPSQFNIQVSPSPPAPGFVPTTNFFSLWMWAPAPASTWYFYAPSLERNGGLAAVQAYATAHGFLDFQTPTVKNLGLGAGLWVSRPQ
jgi:chitodextrinase